MSKIELLAPAGDMESLKYAVENGADAVYIGGKNFGARHYSSNFNNEELGEAIKYCKLRDTKLYVVVNIIIYEKELNKVLEYTDYLYSINIDAIIVQDIGLLNLITGRYPDMEIHASTQMNIHNTNALDILYDLGVSRVVLPRELSLKEIKNLSNSNVELEVFAHGSLCYSYSGQCLISSYIGNRSGNRGMCAQTCRLPFKIENEKKYFMSMKDLNTLEYLKDIISSNITCIKIEGRMKRKEYVGLVTSIYRKYIDLAYSNNYYKVEQVDIIKLKKMFNREFTKGFVNEETSVTTNKPNHQGLEVGRVINSTSKYIEIKLSNSIYINDGLRVESKKDLGLVLNKFYINNKLVREANKNDVIKIFIENTSKINDKVLLTTDNKLMKELKLDLNKNYKKMNLTCDVCQINNDYFIRYFNDNYTSNKIKIETEEEINPLNKERIIDQLSKLGSTTFKIEKINCEVDNINIRISSLNNIRKEAIKSLEKNILSNKRSEIIDNKKTTAKNNSKKDELSFNIVANTTKQYDILSKLNIPNVNIYTKYESNNMVYSNIKSDNKYNEFSISSELGGIKYTKYNSYLLNIVNSSAVNFLKQHGSDKVLLSIECTYNNLSYIIDEIGTNDLEVYLYGHVALMSSKHKLFNNGNSIIDRKGSIFSLQEEDNINKIYSDRPISNFSVFNDLLSQGINCYRIELLNENEQEINKILNFIKHIQCNEESSINIKGKQTLIKS